MEAISAAPTDSRRPRRLGTVLVICAWLGIATQIVMRLHDIGVFHIWRIAIDASVIPFSAALFVLLATAQQEGDPSGQRRLPPRVFLGVGLVPAYYLAVMWLGFTDESYYVWPMGVSAAILFLFVIVFSVVHELSTRPNTVLSSVATSTPFIHQLAGATKACKFTAADRSRREFAYTIDGFLTIVASGLGAFVYFYAFLAKLGYGVHLASASSLAACRDAAVHYVSWHTLDLVPVIAIPETLNWTLPHVFTGGATGWILLGLKIFVVFVVLRLFVSLWALRRPGAP